MSSGEEVYQKAMDLLEADLLEKRLAGLSDEEKEAFMVEYQEAKDNLLSGEIPNNIC